MSMAKRIRMLMDKLTTTRMETQFRLMEIRITMVRKTTVKMMALQITELVNLFKLTKFKIFHYLIRMQTTDWQTTAQHVISSLTTLQHRLGFNTHYLEFIFGRAVFNCQHIHEGLNC